MNETAQIPPRHFRRTPSNDGRRRAARPSGRDKVFGTFQPERTRQDWYGLAAQPQTFNLVTINSLHFRKMHCAGGRARIPIVWRPARQNGV